MSATAITVSTGFKSFFVEFHVKPLQIRYNSLYGKSYAMATVYAKVFKHHQKADGTYNVKIGVFHKNTAKFIDTTHFVSEKQLTKKMTIKDPFVASNINRTLDDYRMEIGSTGERLDFFPVEDLKNHLEKKGEKIDFIKFCSDYIAWLKEKKRLGTAANHSTVRNALVDYFRKNSCSIMEINAMFRHAFDRFLKGNNLLCSFFIFYGIIWEAFFSILLLTPISSPLNSAKPFRRPITG